MSDAVPADCITCLYMGLDPCPEADCFYADKWSCPALVRTQRGLEVVPIPKAHSPARRINPAPGNGPRVFIKAGERSSLASTVHSR